VSAGEYLLLPDFKKPGHVRDLHFKFCGQKLKGSTEFNRIVEDNVPQKYRDRVSKSEKGVDIEICCDALKLASASRLERLFLFTNDDDFTPLCRTLKEFGANVSLIHLSDVINPNESLLMETDSYDVIPKDDLLKMFVAPPTVEPAPAPITTELPEEPAAVSAETPEREPIASDVVEASAATVPEVKKE
jgi:hypothetical protein